MDDPRLRAVMKGGEWFRIQNRADSSARIDIYDEIGFFGTSAADFLDQVRDLDVERIELHLNSPGGEVFDAIAILNILRSHKAKVDVTVDGVAASSASFIAMAGDTVTMARNSELMVHDAFGLSVGNADDMRDLADRLDQVSDNIASIYAERAGGTTAEWRDVMRAETWYTAAEAVDAGLADRVAEKVVATTNRFDLAIFNYAGRSHAPSPRKVTMADPSPAEAAAPAPPPTPPTPDPQVQSAHVPPTASVAGVRNEQEGAGMDPAKLREAFGLTTDSSDEEVKAAIDAAGLGAPKDATELPKDAPQDLAAAARASGAVIVDKGVWEQAQAQIQEGVAAARKLREQERDSILAKAVEDGRIPPANRDYWAQLYDRDPKGTADVINSLRKNLVPVSATGYANYDDGVDPLDEFSGLFPPTGKDR